MKLKKYLYLVTCLILSLLINILTVNVIFASELSKCAPPVDLSRDLSDALAGLNKRQSQTSNDYSTEGAEFEYYYSESALKGMEVFIYGERMKTEITYLLTSMTTYTVEIKDYFYNLPIYSANHFVASTNESRLFVCDNALVGDLNNQTIITHFELVSRIIKQIKK